MNPVYDFSVGDHAVMLGDQIRLEAYHRAITNQVKEGMVVAEIGTGTGILSAYAATRTQAQIFALECYPSTAQMAEDMHRAAGFNQVKILRGESYGITLDPQPQILITETIGAIGPEENIVELCHDFKKRHPAIAKFIPARLKMYAEPIRSKRIVEAERTFYDYFASASFGKFDFKSIRPGLSKIWTSEIRYGSLSDAVAAGECKLLADYEMGVTEKSEFIQTLDFSENQNDDQPMDAVHLFFEAELDSEVLLTSHRADPETHWRHAYVAKPKEFNQLVVSYDSTVGHLEVRWENKSV